MTHLSISPIRKHISLDTYKENATRKAVRAVKDASLPGTSASALAGIRIGEDTLALTRNILCAIPTIGANHPVVTHLGYYAGLLSTFFSFRTLDKGIADYRHSQAIGDSEGKDLAQARMASGGVGLSASLAYLTGRVCDTVAAQPLMTAAFSAAESLFGVGALLSMGISAAGAIRCARFNNQFNHYLNHPDLSPAERVQAAWQFLKGSVSVSPQETAELAAQIEEVYPHLSFEDKKQLLEKQLIDLTEVKVRHLKQRAGNQSLVLIVAHADRLLAKIADPSLRAAGVEESLQVFSKIQMESQTKMALYLLGLLAGLIGAAALIISTFFTLGAAPFILYGIAGTIHLSITAYTGARTILKKAPDAEEIELQPIQDIGV